MPYTALIVDDSKLARMVMVSAFRRVGSDWTLIEVANAEEALQALSDNAIDATLVDFNMPDIDGLELVARMRQTQPRMPVAVVSANVQEEIIARARELKAAFIAKPLTDEALQGFLSGAILRLKKPAQ